MRGAAAAIDPAPTVAVNSRASPAPTCQGQPRRQRGDHARRFPTHVSSCPRGTRCAEERGATGHRAHTRHAGSRSARRLRKGARLEMPQMPRDIEVVPVIAARFDRESAKFGTPMVRVPDGRRTRRASFSWRTGYVRARVSARSARHRSGRPDSRHRADRRAHLVQPGRACGSDGGPARCRCRAGASPPRAGRAGTRPSHTPRRRMSPGGPAGDRGEPVAND